MLDKYLRCMEEGVKFSDRLSGSENCCYIAALLELPNLCQFGDLVESHYLKYPVDQQK